MGLLGYGMIARLGTMVISKMQKKHKSIYSMTLIIEVCGDLFRESQTPRLDHGFLVV
jgi:hypothetical protein